MRGSSTEKRTFDSSCNSLICRPGKKCLIAMRLRWQNCSHVCASTVKIRCRCSYFHRWRGAVYNINCVWFGDTFSPTNKVMSILVSSATHSWSRGRVAKTSQLIKHVISEVQCSECLCLRAPETHHPTACTHISTCIYCTHLASSPPPNTIWIVCLAYLPQKIVIRTISARRGCVYGASCRIGPNLDDRSSASQIPVCTKTIAFNLKCI